MFQPRHVLLFAMSPAVIRPLVSMTSTIYHSYWQHFIHFNSLFKGRRSDLVRHSRIHTNERWVAILTDIIFLSRHYTFTYHSFYFIDHSSVVSLIVAKVLFRWVNKCMCNRLGRAYADPYHACHFTFSVPLWRSICAHILVKDPMFVNILLAIRASVIAVLLHVIGMSFHHYKIIHARYWQSWRTDVHTLENDLINAHLMDAQKALSAKQSSQNTWSTITQQMVNDPKCSGDPLWKNVD